MAILSTIIGFHLLLITMSRSVTSESIVNIWLELSDWGEESQEGPVWIAPEVWIRCRLDCSATVVGGNDSLRALARQSANSRHVTLFLKNESAQPMTVRLPSPGAAWKFTGWGREADAEEADAGIVWRIEPSLPLPLPREMVLEPNRLTMAQMADLTPVKTQPGDGKY